MKRWLWLIPLLAGAVAYAPAPWGQLVWDDAVVYEYQLEPFRTLGDVLRPPDHIMRWSYAYYRPLVLLTYLADARLFGPGAAAGPHIANLLFHLGVTYCVWLLACRLLAHLPGGRAGALVAATVFAVHPIHTEAVSWIAGRSDVLATLFLLPALLLALRWRDARSRAALLLSPFFYLLALLSKETGITALALLPMVLLLAQPVPGAAAPVRAAASWWPLGIGYAAVTGLYWWLRRLADIPDLGLRDRSWADAAWRLLEALAYYIGKVVVPWPQSAIAPWAMVPAPPLVVVILAAAAALVVWSAWRWLRRGDGTWLLAAGWFFATISVALWAAMDAVSNTPLAERHLYLPSVAMTIGVGIAFAGAWARGWRTVPLASAALLLAAYLAGSIDRGLVWRTDLSLWTDATRRAAVAGLAWTNLGLTQLALDQDDQALQSFQRALRDRALEPKWLSRCQNGLGLIAMKRGDEAAAEERFRTSIEAFQEFVDPYKNLGNLYIDRAERLQRAGDIAGRNRAADAAVSYLSTAARRFPNYRPARLLLAAFLLRHGHALEAEGRPDQALRRYQAGLDQLEGLQAEPYRGTAAAGQGAEPSTGQGDPDDLRRQLAAAVVRLQGADAPR